MNTGKSFFMISLISFFISTTSISHAALINIIEDLTVATAEATCYPGENVVNPGTTKYIFSDAIFKNGFFSGYDFQAIRYLNTIDEYGNIDIGAGGSMADNHFFTNTSGFFDTYVYLGPAGAGMDGSHSYASAETAINLRFEVRGNGANIDLFTETERIDVDSWLNLYDETTSSFVAQLSYTDDYNRPNIYLVNSHTYSLVGYLRAESWGGGDPVGRLGFRFNNAHIKSSVPEPATILLFGIGLAGLAAIGRKRRN